MTYTIYTYILMGYFIGSIPFGLILCYLFGYGDIRKIGSGNIGATNVLRTGNRLLALTTLVLDSCKGGLCTLFFLYHSDQTLLSAWIGLSVVIGHNFPLWLKFRGGKGIATTFGVFVVIMPYIGLTLIGLWLVTSKIFKISSLSALTALTASPVLVLLFTDGVLLFPVCFATVLAYWQHRQNILRLIKGKERKIVTNSIDKRGDNGTIH